MYAPRASLIKNLTGRKKSSALYTVIKIAILGRHHTPLVTMKEGNLCSHWPMSTLVQTPYWLAL